MCYFCKYLSICHLGSVNPSHGDKNSGGDGFLSARRSLDGCFFVESHLVALLGGWCWVRSSEGAAPVLLSVSFKAA